jgi:hypothetical protein
MLLAGVGLVVALVVVFVEVPAVIDMAYRSRRDRRSRRNI